MQWGYINHSFPYESGQTQFFPKAFPHACLTVVMGTHTGTTGEGNIFDTNGHIGVHSWNNVSFIYYSDYADGVRGNNFATWIAIGY